MVDLPQDVWEESTQQDEPRREFSMIPPHIAVAHAIEAKKREFDSSDRRSETNFELNVTYEILEGDFQGRKLWHTFVLQSPSAGQVGVSKKQFDAMFKAVGHIGPRTTFDPALFKPVKINIKAFPAGTVDKNYTYQKDTNKIVDFYPVNSTSSTQRQQPTYQAPQQQPQAPNGVMPQAQPPKAGVPSWLARKS